MIMKLQTWKKISVVAGITALSFLTAGCGKKAQFASQSFSATASAGQYTKPKIDILFVQDNSASMITPLATLKPQLDGFLSSMSQSWDLHFTVMPLQSQLSFSSKWIVAQDCSGADVPAVNCIPISNVAAFNNAPTGTNYAWINIFDYATGNLDEGFKNTRLNLSSSSVTTTKFLRADAALAVIVLSNGEDASNMVFPTDFMDRGDGMMVPDFSSTDAVNSYNDFKNYVTTTLKGGTGLTRFYGVVAENNYSNCYGAPTWQGSRYMTMANDLGGNHYELCNGGLNSVLTNIKYQLDSLVEAYRFNYAVVDASHAPVVSSIVVKKNGVTIPQSTTNGWEYVAFKSNQPISYYPQNSNFRSGYMVKLNGTAEYKGTDLIDITYNKQ
jgi:hypothetical protein